MKLLLNPFLLSLIFPNIREIRGLWSSDIDKQWLSLIISTGKYPDFSVERDSPRRDHSPPTSRF